MAFNQNSRLQGNDNQLQKQAEMANFEGIVTLPTIFASSFLNLLIS